MFLGVNLYVHSIYMVCLCSCYILRFLPFSPNAGSGSQKTNILSTCGFLILIQLLLSNAILHQSGEPQNWHQNMERMKHYSMFATFIGIHWKNIGAYTCYGLITQVLMHLYLLFSYWRIRQNVLSFRNRTDFNNSLYSTIVVSIQILVCPYNFFSLSLSILRFPSLYWAFI